MCMLMSLCMPLSLCLWLCFVHLCSSLCLSLPLSVPLSLCLCLSLSWSSFLSLVRCRLCVRVCPCVLPLPGWLSAWTGRPCQSSKVTELAVRFLYVEVIPWSAAFLPGLGVQQHPLLALPKDLEVWPRPGEHGANGKKEFHNDFRF